ncbi:MAG: heme NO-binding domain-containing protein [Ktedonobacteraceae bacterium]
MLGLIFITWEKYLSERFGNALLQNYRAQIGETSATALIASRHYDDKLMLQGVELISQIAHIPVETLLREYGRYFVANALTGKLCAYLLSQISSGRDLLLAMRDTHARLRVAFQGATPPVFEYGESTDPNEVIVIYRSERHLCALLYGTIEGAAQRYNEYVHIVERTCMQQGADACRFEAHFFPNKQHLPYMLTSEQEYNQYLQKQFADLVFSALPSYGHNQGRTLLEMRALLAARGLHSYYQRPALLLEALQHLQFAGLVMSNANDDSSTMMTRRYWRTPIFIGSANPPHAQE